MGCWRDSRKKKSGFDHIKFVKFRKLNFSILKAFVIFLVFQSLVANKAV